MWHRLLLCIVIWFLSFWVPRGLSTLYGQEPSVSILLLDGVVKARWDTLLSSGQLPHIQQLIRNSTYIPNGLTSFPSMTGYAFYPIITGRPAIESGVLGLRWFDRNLDKGNLRNYVGRTNVWMNEDIVDSISTIFELVAPAETASINSYMNRGVKYQSFTGWPLTTAKYQSLPMFRFLDKIPWLGSKHIYSIFEHETLVIEQTIEGLKSNPKVQWVTLPGLDAIHHVEGLTSAYDQLLVHIDGLIGKFLEELKHLGQADQRAVIIMSDHGMQSVEHNVNVPFELLEKTGIRLRRGVSTSITKMTLDEPLEDLEDVDGYYVVNGNLIGFVYLRDPHAEGNDSWRKRLPIHTLEHYKGTNLLEALRDLDGVGMVVYGAGDTAYIQSKEMKAMIIKDGDQWIYKPVEGNPLRFPIDLFNKPLSKEDWLHQTINHDYPGAPVWLQSLMAQPHMGDILVLADHGYDLAADYEILVHNYKGGHGHLYRACMIVPYILHFPGQEAGIEETILPEEVGKRVLGFVGCRKYRG